MKNCLWKRIAAAALVCAMTLTAAACATPEPPGETTGAVATDPAGTAPVSPSETEAPNPHADPGLPSMQFNNASYKVIGELEMSNTDRARDIVYDENVKSDVINEAVHDRNVYVEDKYGVVIEAQFEKKDEVPGIVDRGIASGDPPADVVHCALYYAGSMISAGNLESLYTYSEYLDLTQPYWDQGSAKALSIANVLYLATGDLMITDKMGTWCISFNRDLVNYNKLENLYTVVNTGRWTYDLMYQYAQLVSDAPNHDPKDYFGTTWGVVSGAENNFYLWVGAGGAMIEKDENDIPYLGEITENEFDAMTKVGRMQYDKTVTLFGSNIPVSSAFEGGIKIFQEGHCLFKVGSVTMVEWMRAYDTDFGVLPMPKYSEEQKEYHSALHESFTFAFSILKDSNATAEKRNKISVVSQALACESTATLQEAYYDATLVYKGLRREEDVQMLDLVLNGRVFELGLVFRWTSPLIDQIGSARSEKMVTRLKSMFDSYAASVTRSIDVFLDSQGLA